MQYTVSQISTVSETVASISCRDLCSHLIRFVRLFFLWHVIMRCLNSLLVLYSEQYSSFLVSSLVSSCSPSTSLNQTRTFLQLLHPKLHVQLIQNTWGVLRAVVNFARSTIRYSANFPRENWSRDVNGGKLICARLQRFLFCGDGREVVPFYDRTVQQCVSNVSYVVLQRVNGSYVCS